MPPDLPEPWRLVGPRAENLTRELRRELSERHPLCGREVRPLAQRPDTGDVLFEIVGDHSGYAVVHLTWSDATETDIRWPEIPWFSSLDEWIRDAELEPPPSNDSCCVQWEPEA